MTKTMLKSLLISILFTGVVFAAETKVVIIKADDVQGPGTGWKRFIQESKDLKIKVSCGVVTKSLEKEDPAYAKWLKEEEDSGMVEFWNHGEDHNAWKQGGMEVFEFAGSGLDHQKAHMTRAQDALKKVLGHAPVAFGAPYNRMDADTASVLAERSEIKLIFGGRPKGNKDIIGMPMKLKGEADGVGMAAMTRAAEDHEKDNEVERKRWDQKIERARYEVRLAERQYDAVDPDNRLVARELERRYEGNLRELEATEAEADAKLKELDEPLTERERQQLMSYTENLGALWRAPGTRPQDRKRIARCLIEAVTVTAPHGSEIVKAEVHWKEVRSAASSYPAASPACTATCRRRNSWSWCGTLPRSSPTGRSHASCVANG